MIGATECPRLRGARLTLEPQLAVHAEAMFALLDDDALWAYTARQSLESVDALRERFRLLETRRSPDARELWLNWIVVVQSEEAGFVQASVQEETGEALVGYVIAKRFWSLGLGTEAVGVMLQHLDGALGVSRAVAYVDERNVASLRLLGKLGFRLTDRSDKENQRLELAFDS